ncbi:MAG: TonB-dependent receptor [Bryobacterales bacterium]|nr:TonB-dependent receptor [Bryobacterales bacterium]
MGRLPFAVGLVWCALTLSAQVDVSGRVLDENGTAVSGARLEFLLTGEVQPAVALSDAQGRFLAELARGGRYSLRVRKEGYFELRETGLEAGPSAGELSVTLNHLRELVERVDVVYSPPAVDPEATSDRKQLNAMQVLAVPYPASQDVRSALPMFSGVVQDNKGLVHFNGGSSDQVNYTLDQFNVSDPVTGLLEARVSIDAVRNLELESGRFSPSAGRGSSGSLNLETGMGDDRFRFGATNFVPSIGVERGLVLSKWTPRFTVSGPLARSRAWFHNGFDAFYDVDTIRELPRGQDRSRSLTLSNLTRVQVNLTPSSILSASYLVNYIDRFREGLSFLDPAETTIHRRRSLNMATVRSQTYFPGGWLVEIGFAAGRGVLRERPEGNSTFEISPLGRRGNFFVDLARNTDRQQWLVTGHLPVVQMRGSHRIRVGADLQRSGFDQLATRHDYRVLRADMSLARQVSFTGGGRLRRRHFETALYADDRWAPVEGLVLEAGLRLDWDQIVRDLLFSPRLSAAWTPGWAGGVKLAAGFGVFNDALNLLMLTRHQDQYSLTTFFSKDGLPSGEPVIMGFQADEQSLETPRARIYSLSAERVLPGGFLGKASYLHRAGWKGLTSAQPPGGLLPGPVYYVLRNQRGDRYDAVDLTFRRTFAGQYEWLAGYTISSARTNAVMEYSLENPVFGGQGPGPWNWDTPHRLLSWGWAPVPSVRGPRFVRSVLQELSVSYLLEARSGFPFSVVNEENFVVGRPNRRRFPSYFNLNLHFEKKFRFWRYLWAWRCGLNNLTNHGNPNVVNNNIDSPSFLAYGRGQQRAWNVRLRFLGRR